MRHSKFYTFLFLFFTNFAFCQTPAPPTNLSGEAFENHVEFAWDAVPGATAYKIYKSTDGGNTFQYLKTTQKRAHDFDWTGDEGQNLALQYKVTAVGNFASESDPSPALPLQTAPMNDEQLLEMTQKSTFKFFWEFGHPVSGMARDRNNGDDNIVTSGGTGFGIMAMVVAAERGWVSRADIVDRLMKICTFLQAGDRFHGAWPHFINGTTGKVIPFSQYDNGADLVETAFLVQGLLTARQYFDENSPSETALRDLITQLWEGVEWDWFRRNGGSVLYWHWSPNFGWQINFALRGFHEAAITYLLAVASPTHPVPPSLYTNGWISTGYVNNSTIYGHKLYCGPSLGGPLFFAHYSYLGFDPRNKKDQVCNYFVRNRNHTLVNRAACIDNVEHHVGYSADCWGLTASDGPSGYFAHDPIPSNDNGTISPTAALSSMPYTPDESMAVLRHFYRVLGDRIWGVYGFRDAFNLNVNWFAPSFLAIDQGPIIGMIENHRTGLLWENFMKNPEIQPMLDAVGFVPDFVGAEEPENQGVAPVSVRVFPNPVAPGETFDVEVLGLENSPFSAELVDAFGRRVAGFQGLSTFKKLTTLSVAGLKISPGMYFLKLQTADGQEFSRKIVVL